MNAPSRKIRWGILGYARIARESVMPAILRASNAELTALASRDENKLAEARTRFPSLKTHRGYEELLRDPSIDAVYIPLPNAMHREWTIKAAEHGKHILCEKPLALNAAECREMIDAAAAHGVTLMEAFMYRYTDRTRQVVELVRSGALGEVKFIHASFRFLLTNPVSIKLRPELGGGALYDVGCYPVNFAGLIMDTALGQVGASRPETLSVECVRTGGVDEILSALLKYPNGVIASLHCGFNAQKRITAEIVGTKGAVEIPETFFDNPGSLIVTIGEERKEIPVAASDRYRFEVEDFSNALLEKCPPQFTLTETLRNAGVLDRLFAASNA